MFILLLVAIFVVLCPINAFDAQSAPPAQGLQAGNADLGSCSYQATCTVSGIEGVCVSTSSGCCSGTITSGLCPGSSDIKCCTNNSCSTPQGSGTCMQTSACTGTSVSGYCVGPSEVQCCISGTPPVPDDSEYGIDVCDPVSSSTASCFVNGGKSFIIPRGYHSTGTVDTAVCNTIINAANAGIKTRDTYMFPCKRVDFNVCSLFMDMPLSHPLLNFGAPTFSF